MSWVHPILWIDFAAWFKFHLWCVGKVLDNSWWFSAGLNYHLLRFYLVKNSTTLIYYYSVALKYLTQILNLVRIPEVVNYCWYHSDCCCTCGPDSLIAVATTLIVTWPLLTTYVVDLLTRPVNYRCCHSDRCPAIADHPLRRPVEQTRELLLL